mgnify:CR=1 FL=1
MNVRIIRIADDYVLNVRHTDDLLEQGVFKDEAECLKAEAALKKVGRWYLDAETMLLPGR